MEECGQRQTTSDSGYVSVITLYRAKRCDGCPLASRCKTSKGDRVVGVNHRLNAYKKEAFELLTSELGLEHRSKRPVEPEAAFGQMKFDMAINDSDILAKRRFIWTSVFMPCLPTKKNVRNKAT